MRCPPPHRDVESVRPQLPTPLEVRRFRTRCTEFPQGDIPLHHHSHHQPQHTLPIMVRRRTQLHHGHPTQLACHR